MVYLLSQNFFDKSSKPCCLFYFAYKMQKCSQHTNSGILLLELPLYLGGKGVKYGILMKPQ